MKYKTYTLKSKNFPPLAENKEFSSVKNMIIRTVLKLDEAQELAEGKATEHDTESENNFESPSYAGVIISLFANLSRIICDDYSRSQRQLQSNVDRKLKSAINQKKESLGIKTTDSYHYEY